MMSEQIKRKLILEDGSEYIGTAFGSLSQKKVEIVFNTSMVGYQEIISDPSYTYQTVVMTYPLIGNYGMCEEDYETITPTISGMVVKEYCDEPSNFRAKTSLGDIMKQYDIVGIAGVDTRKLTRHIRNFGSCKAYICDMEMDTDKAVKELKEWSLETDAVSKVSTKEIYEYSYDFNPEFPVPNCPSFTSSKGSHIVAIDCGMKHNILREFVRRECKVSVVPWNTDANTILGMKPDGVFISNGPGDPTDVQETITTIKELIGKVPIFGICLGHQIISLAYGAKTYKLKFGHRGGNHPVKNLDTDKIEITSQNHSYAVDEESLKTTKLRATHINLLDNTIEGAMCEADKVFSVQYHPESAPGPQDSSYLFDDFMKLIASNREGK